MFARKCGWRWGPPATQTPPHPSQDPHSPDRVTGNGGAAEAGEGAGVGPRWAQSLRARPAFAVHGHGHVQGLAWAEMGGAASPAGAWTVRDTTINQRGRPLRPEDGPAHCGDASDAGNGLMGNREEKRKAPCPLAKGGVAGLARVEWATDGHRLASTPAIRFMCVANTQFFW